MTELSRRSFFGALAAAGAVAALPTPLRKAALSGGKSRRAMSSATLSAGSATIKRGDVFTIAGVYAAGASRLQQFTVLAESGGNSITTRRA